VKDVVARARVSVKINVPMDVVQVVLADVTVNVMAVVGNRVRDSLPRNMIRAKNRVRVHALDVLVVLQAVLVQDAQIHVLVAVKILLRVQQLTRLHHVTVIVRHRAHQHVDHHQIILAAHQPLLGVVMDAPLYAHVLVDLHVLDSVVDVVQVVDQVVLVPVREDVLEVVIKPVRQHVLIIHTRLMEIIIIPQILTEIKVIKRIEAE